MTADTRRVQIKRRRWDAAAGAFVTTGDVIEAVDEERIASGMARQSRW